MKNLLKIMIVTALAVFIGSCSKENSEDPMTLMHKGVQRNISASAMLTSTSETNKACFNTTNGKVTWESGDQINVNGTNLTETTVNNNVSQPEASFGGTAYALTSGDNEIYWAVYPTTLAGAYNNGIPSEFGTSSLTFTLPTTQTYASSGNTMSGNTYMAGYANVPQGQTDIAFSMHNLGALLHLNLTAATGVNANVQKIELTTRNGALAGGFTVSTDLTTIAPAASATKSLVLNLTNGINNYIDISNGADIYVLLPPMSSKDLTIRIFNTDNQYTEKTIASASFVRSYIYHNVTTGIDFSEMEDVYYFTVNDQDKKVVFSPGNLQWSATNGGTTATTHRTAEGTAAGTWRFAEHQWNYVGTSNYGNVYNNANVKSDNAQISQNYQGWIDLFGWGTSGYNNKYPYMTETNNPSYGNGDNDITNTNYDWGKYNDIYNPAKQRTDPFGTWYTLTSEEWVYLFHRRGKLGAAKVNDIKGIVMLPDNWNPTLPAGFPTFRNTQSSYADNQYTPEQWAIMEQYGAVFIPSTYNRERTTLTNKSSNFRIWSSTRSGSQQALLGYIFVGGTTQSTTQDYRYLGEAVRLVRDYNGQ